MTKEIYLTSIGVNLILYCWSYKFKKRALKNLFWSFAAVLFLFMASQEDKVDSLNYKNAFFGDSLIIPDIGYNYICKIFNKISSNYYYFNFTQALLTLASIFITSKKLKVDSFISLTSYLLYFAIIRDFSQSRIALAINLYLIFGFQKSMWKETFWIVMGSTIHKSILVLFGPLFIYYAFKEINDGKLVYFKVILCLLSGFLIYLIATFCSFQIDERLEIYTDFNSPYSASGFNWIPSGFLGFFLFLNFISKTNFLLSQKGLFLFFCCLTSVSISIYISFNYFIASRLSSVLLSFIPFLFGFFFLEKKTRKITLGFLLLLLFMQAFSETTSKVLQQIKIVN